MCETDTHKTFLRGINDLHEWRAVSGSWMGTINIVKMTMLPKVIYKFNVISIKIPREFL